MSHVVSPAWIKVTDGLPDDGVNVLIYHVLGDRDRSEVPHAFDVACVLDGKWILPWDRDGKNHIVWVTHWRPLPLEPRTNNGEPQGELVPYADYCSLQDKCEALHLVLSVVSAKAEISSEKLIELLNDAEIEAKHLRSNYGH